MKEFAQRYHNRTFTQIHESLTNQDKVSRILLRERVNMRLAQYPEGTQIAGVAYEIEKQKQWPEKEVRCYFLVVNIILTG